MNRPDHGSVSCEVQDVAPAACNASRLLPQRALPLPCAGTVPARMRILHVGVSRVSCESATRAVLSWAEAGESRYVCVVSAHGFVAARPRCRATSEGPDAARPDAPRSREFREILNEADMVTPDGMPVVWLMRACGPPGHSARGQTRVYGPDLMLHVCRECASAGVPVFFYGATDRTLSRLESRLLERLPHLAVAGRYAPPFRPLTPEEDAEVVGRIRESGARVVFVGLSTPKQERWMRDHVKTDDSRTDRVIHAVMIGVGAAFDIHAGNVRAAPGWMQRSGLEWFYRLLSEPRRLWRRYAVVVPTFAAMALAQLVRGRESA